MHVDHCFEQLDRTVVGIDLHGAEADGSEPDVNTDLVMDSLDVLR